MAKYVPSPRDWVREQTKLNDLGSGNLPLRRIHLTPNTKSAPSGGFRSLSQILFCRRHHVIAPPLMSEFGQGRRGSTSHDRGA